MILAEPLHDRRLAVGTLRYGDTLKLPALADDCFGVLIAEPQPALPVGFHGIDRTGAQRRRVVGVEDGETDSVKPCESGGGRIPQITVAILGDTENRLAPEAVFGSPSPDEIVRRFSRP